MNRKELTMLLFNGIIDCFKLEIKMSKMAKLPEMAKEYQRQMNEFLKFDFKNINISLLSQLHDKHVLSVRILNELI